MHVWNGINITCRLGCEFHSAEYSMEFSHFKNHILLNVSKHKNSVQRMWWQSGTWIICFDMRNFKCQVNLNLVFIIFLSTQPASRKFRMEHYRFQGSAELGTSACHGKWVRSSGLQGKFQQGNGAVTKTTLLKYQHSLSHHSYITQ